MFELLTEALHTIYHLIPCHIILYYILLLYSIFNIRLYCVTNLPCHRRKQQEEHHGRRFESSQCMLLLPEGSKEPTTVAWTRKASFAVKEMVVSRNCGSLALGVLITRALLLWSTGHSRLQQAGIPDWDDVCLFSFFSGLWAWGRVIFQLSGFYCKESMVPNSCGWFQESAALIQNLNSGALALWLGYPGKGPQLLETALWVCKQGTRHPVCLSRDCSVFGQPSLYSQGHATPM